MPVGAKLISTLSLSLSLPVPRKCVYLHVCKRGIAENLSHLNVRTDKKKWEKTERTYAIDWKKKESEGEREIRLFTFLNRRA